MCRHRSSSLRPKAQLVVLGVFTNSFHAKARFEPKFLKSRQKSTENFLSVWRKWDQNVKFGWKHNAILASGSWELASALASSTSGLVNIPAICHTAQPSSAVKTTSPCQRRMSSDSSYRLTEIVGKKHWILRAERQKRHNIRIHSLHLSTSGN